MGKYIMALDAGTTSNRCILFNEKGERCVIMIMHTTKARIMITYPCGCGSLSGDRNHHASGNY